MPHPCLIGSCKSGSPRNESLFVFKSKDLRLIVEKTKTGSTWMP